MTFNTAWPHVWIALGAMMFGGFSLNLPQVRSGRLARLSPELRLIACHTIATLVLMTFAFLDRTHPPSPVDAYWFAAATWAVATIALLGFRGARWSLARARKAG